MKRVGSAVLAVLLATLSVPSPAPAADAPAGTLTVGVHVTLVSRWLDPADTEGLITPFNTAPAEDLRVKP